MIASGHPETIAFDTLEAQSANESLVHEVDHSHGLQIPTSSPVPRLWSQDHGDVSPFAHGMLVELLDFEPCASDGGVRYEI